MFKSHIQNNQFHKFYLNAIGITFIGNGFQYIGSLWLMYSLTKSVAMISILFSIKFISNTIGSYYSVRIAERYNKVNLCIIADVTRMFIILSVLIAFCYTETEGIILLIYVLELFLGFVSPLFIIASASLIKLHVKSENMLALFRARELAMQLGIIIGTGTAGLIIAYSNINLLFALNALSYLISAALLYKLRLKSDVMSSLAPKDITPHGNRSICKVLKSHPNIFYIYVISIFIIIPALVFDNVLAEYVSLWLNSNEKLLGFIESAYSLGALLAILGINFALMLVKKSIHSILIMLLFGTVYLTLGLISNISITLILCVITGLIGITLKVITETLLQVNTKVQDVSCVQGFLLFAQNSCALIIFTVVGALNQYIQANVFFILCGVVTLLVAIPFGLLLSNLHINNTRRN